jgi:hypothetical protein
LFPWLGNSSRKTCMKLIPRRYRKWRMSKFAAPVQLPFLAVLPLFYYWLHHIFWNYFCCAVRQGVLSITLYMSPRRWQGGNSQVKKVESILSAFDVRTIIKSDLIMWLLIYIICWRMGQLMVCLVVNLLNQWFSSVAFSVPGHAECYLVLLIFKYFQSLEMEIFSNFECFSMRETDV